MCAGQLNFKPSLGVVGVAGRMGQMLVQVIADSEAVTLGGASEQPGHAWLGNNIGVNSDSGEGSVTIFEDPVQAFQHVDAIVDFSSPAATVRVAEAAASLGKVHVIGTTGLSHDDYKKIAEAARSTVIVRAGNMSLGVNLLVQLTNSVARALDADFDIEVIETHHRHKVDAPSGTALMLGEAAASGRGLEDQFVFDRGRDGHTGPRKRGNIGYSAIRGGDIVGEHDVLFAGLGERIVLRHVATDRSIYAQGAVKAALWGIGRPPGEYDMKDVLGL